MMQVRCQRCGWTFTLSRDAIGYAVAEAQAEHAEYYQENCPKCRNAVKIQVKELRRRLPADYVLPELLPKPQPIRVAKEETPQPAPSAPPPAGAKPKPAGPPAAKTATPKPAAAKSEKTTRAKTKTSAPAAPKSAKRAAKPKTKSRAKTAPKRAARKK